MQWHWNRRRRRRTGLATLAGCLVFGNPAGSEEPANAPGAPPPVALDRLLKLPAPTEAQRERIGNATRNEWRARFASARSEYEAAQKALDDAQEKMGEEATDTDSWKIAPPVGSAAGASDAPLNYQLRQEIRRQRDELVRSERRLQDLTIEADLAGVPASWRD